MATTYYNKTKHDLGVVDPQSAYDVVGMMLAKVKNPDGTKVPAWSEYDDQYLAQQFFTGQPSYVNTPPERRLIHDKKNWRAGFGKKYQDDSEPSRYFASYGMDLSNEGMAVPGAIASTVTLPTITATNEANLDWETWTNSTTPGTWTEDLALTQSTQVYHGGASSGTLASSLTSWTLVAHQHVLWNTQYQSRTFHLRGWGRCDRAFASGDYGVKFAIWDGQTRTYSGVCGNVASNTWEQSTWATKVLASNASVLDIEVYIKDNGSATNFYFDDMEFVDPTVGTIPCHADFNSLMYFAYGNNLISMNGSGTISYVYSFPAAITSLEVFTDGKLYIALGHSNAYWEMTTTPAFTENTLAVNKFKFFKTVFTTAPTMYGNATDYSVRSNTDPSSGGANPWGDATTICSSDVDITQLMSESGALYIMTTNVPYYLTSAGAVKNDLAPELAAIAATTSGKNSTYFNGFYYIPAGTQTLLETDGTTNTYRNPSSYSMDLSDFAGRVQAVTHDEQWLFAIVDNSGTLEILKGGNVLVDGVSQWVWHPYCEITLTDCETAWVSTVYQKRLWISSTVAAESLYYIPLPTGYGNVSADTNRTFKTNGYFIDTFIDHNFRSDKKAFNKVTATLGHTFDTDIYYECWYKKLEDSDWTDAGDFKGTATDRRPVLYVPADASNYNPTSTMMQFKFIAKTDSTTTAPILLNYTVESILYPPIGKIYAAKVLMGENVLSRQGMPEPNMYTKIKTTLDNAVSATYPVTIYDLEGTSYTVKFLPLPADVKRREAISYEEGRPIEWVYNVLMQVVTVSGVGISASTEAGYRIPRTATIVVAASDALARSKVQADYTCDGTADEVQINAAIASLPSAGGSIYLTEGTFTLSARIDLLDKLHLYGAGKRATVIQPASGYTGDLMYGNGVTGAWYLALSDFYLYNSGAIGLHLIDAALSSFKRIDSYYHTTGGILVNATVSANSFNLEFEECATLYNDGFGFQSGGTAGPVGVTLIKHSSASNGGDGIFLNGGVHCGVIEPWVEANGGYGIFVWGRDNAIRGGVVTSSTLDNILFDSTIGTGTCNSVEGTRIAGGSAYSIYANNQNNLLLLKVHVEGGAALGSIYLYQNCDDTLIESCRTQSTAAGKNSLTIAHSSDDNTCLLQNNFDSTTSDSGTGTRTL